MYTKDEIKEELIKELTHQTRSHIINEELRKTIVDRLFDENAIEIVELSKKDLIFIKSNRESTSVLFDEDNPPKIIRYNSFAAAEIVESLFTAFTEENPVTWAYTVLTIINSLMKIRKNIPEREGILFSIIYNGEGRRTTYEDAQQLYINALKTDQGAAINEFNSALQNLIQIGCIHKSDNLLKVVDKVIIHRD